MDGRRGHGALTRGENADNPGNRTPGDMPQAATIPRVPPAEVIISDVNVGFATPSDAVEMAELSRKYIEHDLSWRYTPARVRELLRDADKNVVVARKADSLVGFGIMTYADQNANLDLLAVKEGHRRRGVGRQVVAWLEEVARTAGILTIFVQVRQINRGAIKFYIRCGFQIIDEVTGYYGGRESAVIMAKSIAEIVVVR